MSDSVRDETQEDIVYDSRIIQNVLPSDLNDNIFESLSKELEPYWSEMYNRGHAVSRLVCIQGSVRQNGDEPLYRHPTDEQPSLHNWTPTVKVLRDIVANRIQQPTINHALIQLYRHCDDFISEHADKTLDITKHTSVVNLSLGATRTMILRPKKDNDGGNDNQPRTSIRVPMDHGSIFVLGWQTNKLMTHEIRKDKRLSKFKTQQELAFHGVRISLTFRSIATYMKPTGAIYGQGAPKVPSTLTKQKEEAALIQAFSVENRRSNYDWNDLYGKGFSVINFKISNNKEIE